MHERLVYPIRRVLLPRFVAEPCCSLSSPAAQLLRWGPFGHPKRANGGGHSEHHRPAPTCKCHRSVSFSHGAQSISVALHSLLRLLRRCDKHLLNLFLSCSVRSRSGNFPSFCGAHLQSGQVVHLLRSFELCQRHFRGVDGHGGFGLRSSCAVRLAHRAAHFWKGQAVNSRCLKIF